MITEIPTIVSLISIDGSSSGLLNYSDCCL